MRSYIIYMGVIAGCIPLQGVASRYKGDQHWDLYGDFLYMKRSDLHGTPLVKDDAKTVIRSKDLIHQFDFEPGYRIGLVYSPNSKYGFEGVFSHWEPWEGVKKKSRNDALSFPFDNPAYDENFTDASLARAKYTQHLWDAQLNFWRYYTPRLREYFGFSALVGWRFMHWNEQFQLQMTKESDTSSYRIKTENRLLTLQAGFDFQMHPARLLTWELLVKGGLFANNSQQSQFLGAFNDELTVRNSTRRKWQVGFLGDVSLQMRIECFSWLNLHAGYEALFLSGLSLAPEQVSKHTGHRAGKRDHTKGGAVIQGPFAGATFRF